MPQLRGEPGLLVIAAGAVRRLPAKIRRPGPPPPAGGGPACSSRQPRTGRFVRGRHPSQRDWWQRKGRRGGSPPMTGSGVAGAGLRQSRIDLLSPEFADCAAGVPGGLAGTTKPRAALGREGRAQSDVRPAPEAPAGGGCVGLGSRQSMACDCVGVRTGYSPGQHPWYS